MLKRDANGQFRFREVGFFKKKRLMRFYTGKFSAQGEFDEDQFNSLLAQQQQTPIVVLHETAGKKKWWMFRSEFYWEDEGFTEAEVKALILDKLQQKQKKVQRAIARISQDESAVTNRQPIPDEIKLFVWQRDGGRCVKCGIRENLEFDHIIPIAKGGSNTARNLQLLCEKCNREKGANLT